MTKRVFTDMREYGRVDLAGTFPSTAGSQAPVPAELLDGAMAAIEREGFVVFERLFSEETVEAIRADVAPRFAAKTGRNNFEGFATKRLYAVIEKTLVCNEMVEHPLVLGLLDRILEPNYLLSQLQVIDILPREAQQPFHFDDAFYSVPRPRKPLSAATIIAIDPFTNENGATVVIPASHTWDDRAPNEGDSARAKSVVMPAGSMLFFVGTLWHGGGANRTERGRMCVTAQYCAPWCRQQENYALSISKKRVKECSEHIQRMLGYSIHAPFMGFVNGMHPRRVLEDD